jgi:hypothetical protein
MVIVLFIPYNAKEGSLSEFFFSKIQEDFNNPVALESTFVKEILIYSLLTSLKLISSSSLFSPVPVLIKALCEVLLAIAKVYFVPLVPLIPKVK